MRRAFAYILLVLGVFLIATAFLARFWILPNAEKAPLDRYEQTPSSGTASVLFDAATLSVKKDVPLTSLRITRADVNASNDSTAVYDSFSSVQDPDKNAISVLQERYAFDRTTSQMVDCCGTEVDGTPIKDFSGIFPLKFPFNVKQQTYQYFDATLKKALPMEFKGTEEIDGLQVYRFVQTIAATKFTTLEVPGTLVGSTEATLEADRVYKNVRTLWVEPTTGALIRGQEEQKQTLRVPGGSTDALTLLDAKLAFTDAYVAQTAADAKDNVAKLNMLGTTLPLVAGILGLVCLIGALLLGRRRGESTSDAPGAVGPTAG